MSDAVLLTLESGVARITLNRPDRLNAFDEEMAAAWDDATARATEDRRTRAIVIDARGKGFCAGGDVRAISAFGREGARIERLAATIGGGIRRLVGAPIPVVCAVQGVAAGGGLGVVLASDCAIAAEGARFGSLYSNIGLTPDLSVSAQLGAAVGERRALELVLTDRMLSAQEACEWGLVTRVVPDSAVGESATVLAQAWADGASAALGAAKSLIRSRAGRPFDEQLVTEARTIADALAGDEAQRLIATFLGARS